MNDKKFFVMIVILCCFLSCHQTISSAARQNHDNVENLDCADDKDRRKNTKDCEKIHVSDPPQYGNSIL